MSTWPWGEHKPGCNAGLIDMQPTGASGTSGCGKGWMEPVGSFPADISPYGVFDMAGSLSEWTADAYNAAYYASSPTKDPQGPASTDSYHVTRGGSYQTIDGNDTRLSARRRHNTQASWLGFRCVKDVK